MRKIYTVVFALMVLLSLTMSAMATDTTMVKVDDVSTIGGGTIIPSVIPDTPAPAGDATPPEDDVMKTKHDTVKNSINNIR